jgi:hypothetical protein
MFNVFSSHIFNPKIVNNQHEGDRMGEILPQTRCMPTLVISMGEEPFVEEFICQDSSLGKAPNGVAHFNINKPILCMFLQVVLLPCPGWEEGERHFHVLESVKWGRQVKILDVEAHEFCTFGAEDAVLH